MPWTQTAGSLKGPAGEGGSGGGTGEPSAGLWTSKYRQIGVNGVASGLGLPNVGRYAGASFNQSMTTLVPTVGYNIYWPHYAGAGGTVSSLRVNVTSWSAGNLARLGLYRNVTTTPDPYPGALIADFGNVDVSTTGLRTITPAAPLVLEPGALYWFVYQNVGGTTASTIRALNTTSMWTELFGSQGDMGTTLVSSYDQSVTGTTTSAFPATTPTTGLGRRGGNVPAVMLFFSA
jgi:hypothetical protein